jgi:hypothetical protein
MWQGSGAIRRMLKEVALRSAETYSSGGAPQERGPYCGQFHHHWCN